MLVCTAKQLKFIDSSGSKGGQVSGIFPDAVLRFKGPFTRVVSSKLTLINPSNEHVCFKVWTTNPKTNCVRPNNGILAPKEMLTMKVKLLPFDYDPDGKCKQKFMLRSVVVPNADVEAGTVWESANPSDIMSTKLRCVFYAPGEQSMAEAGDSSCDSQTPGQAVGTLAGGETTSIQGPGLSTRVPLFISKLSLANTSDEFVCFRIKTTAPERYHVARNTGILTPRQTLQVKITLKPSAYDPNRTKTDKFMVMSIVVPNSNVDAETVWKSANPSVTVSTKLLCVFESPGEQKMAEGTEEECENVPCDNATAPPVHKYCKDSQEDMNGGVPEATSSRYPKCILPECQRTGSPELADLCSLCHEQNMKIQKQLVDAIRPLNLGDRRPGFIRPIDLMSSATPKQAAPRQSLGSQPAAPATVRRKEPQAASCQLTSDSKTGEVTEGKCKLRRCENAAAPPYKYCEDCLEDMVDGGLISPPLPTTSAVGRTDEGQGAASSEYMTPVTPEDQPKSEECAICMDEAIETAFLTCGHSCACHVCGMDMKDRPCPICREIVTDVLRIYRT